MEKFDYQPYSSALMGASVNLIDGAMTPGFDYGQNGYDLNSAKTYGQEKGSKIGGGVGAGIGALLAPITGGLSIPIGQLLGSTVGGLIGGNAAANKAQPILDNRQAKNDNFVSMYQQVARQGQIDSAQRQGHVFIDNQYRTNLPSL